MKKIKLHGQSKSFDKTFLILTLVLVFLGLIALADASAPQALNNYGDKFYLVKQQVVWVAIGAIAFFVVSKIHYSFWEKIATPFFFASIALLVVVLIPGLGFCR